MLATITPITSRIYLGDCLAVLETLADESVDCIITDPPYGISYLSRSHSLPLTKIANDKGNEAYKLLDNALAIAWKKLKPDRHVFIFTNFQAYEYMAPIVRKYFNLKGACVWVKNNGTRGDVKATFSRAHEDIIHAQKGRRWLFGKRDFDVFQFKRVATQHMQHPTEKPVALLKYLIEKSTLPGEVVLDPFAGVGSTLVAAQQTGRIPVGIELERAFAEVAASRTGLSLSNLQS
jgi:DNA modification methylase